MLRVLAGIVGASMAVLGAHGICVWVVLPAPPFGSLAACDVPTMSRLFLVLDMPTPVLGSTVHWMSVKAYASWVVPVLMLAVGIWAVVMSGTADMLARQLRKKRFW